MAGVPGFTPDPTAQRQTQDTTRQVQGQTTGVPAPEVAAPPPGQVPESLETSAPAGVPGFTPELREGPSAAQSRAGGVAAPSEPLSPARQEAVQRGEDVVKGTAGFALAGIPFTGGALMARPAYKWAVSQWPKLTKMPLPILRVLFGAATEEGVAAIQGAAPEWAGGGNYSLGVRGGLALGTAGLVEGGYEAARRAPGAVGYVARRLPATAPWMASRDRAVRLEQKASEAAARSAHAETLKGARKEVTLADRAAQLEAGKAATARGELSGARGEAAVAQAEAGAAGVGAGAAAADAEQRAAQFATNPLGRGSPPMAPGPATTTPGTATELANRAARGVRPDLGAWQSEKLAVGDAMLPKTTLPDGTQAFTAYMPSMRQENPQWTVKLSELGLPAEGRLPPVWNDFLTTQLGPRYKERFTNEEIADYLKGLNESGWRGALANPETRTVSKRTVREHANQVKAEWQREVESHTGVGPEAWRHINEGRHAFAVGNEINQLLKQEGVYYREKDLPERLFDMRALQQAAHRNLSKIKARLSDDEFEAFNAVVFHGQDVSGRVPALQSYFDTSASKAVQAHRAGLTVSQAEAKVAAAEARAAGLQQTTEQARARLAAIPKLQLQSAPQGQSRWGEMALTRIALDAFILNRLAAR